MLINSLNIFKFRLYISLTMGSDTETDGCCLKYKNMTYRCRILYSIIKLYYNKDGDTMDLEMKLNSLYICVKNMERAINFYENFFDQKADAKDEIFSIFNFNNFRFCLFNNSKVNEEVIWGDNCLPSFEVNDMNKLIEKIRVMNAEIVFPLTKINDNWVLEFKDSEGNDIEVYCKCK